MESSIIKKKKFKQIKRELRSAHIKNINLQVHCPGEKTMPPLSWGNDQALKKRLMNHMDKIQERSQFTSAFRNQFSLCCY